MSKTNKYNLPFLISLATIIFCWYIFTATNFVDKLFLPSFSDLLKSFVTLFREKEFAWDITISIWRVWFSFLLSFVIAIPLALAMSESKLLRNVVSPYIDFIRYLPVPALIPLSILFLGIGVCLVNP